jgi:hypothetical protein
LRTYREAGDISQDELVALAHSREVMSATSLRYKPGAARHRVRAARADRNAHDAYDMLKEAAATYLEAQLELLVAAGRNRPESGPFRAG